MKKLVILSVLFTSMLTFAQNTINSREGYTPNIGIMVNMLDDLKNRVTKRVQNANQEQTDFLLDDKANRVGAMIMHLAATEAIYQKLSFEGSEFNKEEEEKWNTALNLGDKAREELKGKPIKYYLDLWDEVREKTLATLKTKDDEWFASTMNEHMNHHWAWFHVMEHQANHMGQIAMLASRGPSK
ncbi:DinB family protein [Maribacter halichondriae]|uniref:DinB family protein n=1 Tax=Maribacter halichondriae TaxID=2980554 RepID=UPI00235A2EB2|nr:DinB family protein [Maribacter sp. Hal144]